MGFDDGVEELVCARRAASSTEYAAKLSQASHLGEGLYIHARVSEATAISAAGIWAGRGAKESVSSHGGIRLSSVSSGRQARLISCKYPGRIERPEFGALKLNLQSRPVSNGKVLIHNFKVGML